MLGRELPTRVALTPISWLIFNRNSGSLQNGIAAPPHRNIHRTRILLWPLAALRLPPAKYSPLPPVAAFAFSALRLRLRFGSPCGEGVVPPELRPDATTPAPPTCSFLHRRHHPAGSVVLRFARTWIYYVRWLANARHRPSIHHRRLGSCLVIASRQLLPGEGVGLACLRLTVPVRLRSAILAATFPDSPPPAGAHAPTNGRQ